MYLILKYGESAYTVTIQCSKAGACPGEVQAAAHETEARCTHTRLAEPLLWLGVGHVVTVGAKFNLVKLKTNRKHTHKPLYQFTWIKSMR